MHVPVTDEKWATNGMAYLVTSYVLLIAQKHRIIVIAMIFWFPAESGNTHETRKGHLTKYFLLKMNGFWSRFLQLLAKYSLKWDVVFIAMQTCHSPLTCSACQSFRSLTFPPPLGGEEGSAGGAGAAGEGMRRGAEVKWQVGRGGMTAEGVGFLWKFFVGEKKEVKTKEESEVPR